MLAGGYSPTRGEPLWLTSGGGGRDDSDELTCVLDGCVDNLDELAKALGVPEGDAGVVLAAAWRTWDESMVHRLRGAFVVLVWDRPKRRGIIAVDQLGTRPVYYRRQAGGLIFAAEVEALLGLLDRRPGPDPVHLAHWLSFTDPPPGGTFYEGIERLPGGTYLRLTCAGAEPVSYWPRSAASAVRSREEAAAELRRLLEQGVSRMLRGGPDETGLLLSGGLDSATVASLAAARLGRDRLRTYSATFPGVSSVDESGLIDGLAERFGLLRFSLAVTRGSAVRGSLEFLERAQLPPSSPNLFFWTPLLQRASSQGVRFMLDGEGGDELFAAALPLAADRLRRGHPADAYRLIMRLPWGAATPPRRHVLRVGFDYAVRGALPQPARRLVGPLGLETPDTPFWLNAHTARMHQATLDADRWMVRPGPRWRAWLLHIIRDSTGGPQLARDHVRQRSHMAGLVERHPLLDLDVVEFVLQSDPELAFDRHFDRALLRESMRGILPDSVRRRTEKSSFDAPFQQSLTRELNPISRLLCDPQCELRAYVDVETVRNEVLGRPGRQFALGGRAWALAVWRLVTAELWLRLQRDLLDPRAALERCGFPGDSLDSPSLSHP